MSAATMTRTAYWCQTCAVPLPNGADIYGGVGQTFCLTCWYAFLDGEVPDKDDAAARKTFLEKRRDSMRNRRRDAYDEISNLRDEVSEYDERIRAIEIELDGGGRCDEKDEA